MDGTAASLLSRNFNPISDKCILDDLVVLGQQPSIPWCRCRIRFRPTS